MKILFLTSRFPFPPIGGDKLRTFNFIKYLKKNHYLTLISLIENERELALERIANYQQYYDKLITVQLPKSKSYKNCLKGLFSQVPLQIHYYFSERMKEEVAKELQNGYDIIFCHLIRMAQYLPKNNNIHKVIDFTDAISLNYKRCKKVRKGLFSIINLIEAKRVREYEFNSIKESNISIFISNVDANYLINDYNKNKIKVITNGVDLDTFKFNQTNYDENQILFLGNMRTFPNTDAVVYFVQEIFPLLKQAQPKLKFCIVGNQPTRTVLRLHDGKNIFVTGFVNSVIPFLKNSAVFVAPMRVGAGIQNKILEALAVGTPVVTTTIGAEGLDEHRLTIANSPEEFYRKSMSLINNKELRNKMVHIGRKYVEENFHWHNRLGDLDKYIKNGNICKK